MVPPKVLRIASRKRSGRFAALSKVVPRVTTTSSRLSGFWPPTIRATSGTGRGVVVATSLGSLPSRSPISRLSQVESARFDMLSHLAISSHQAWLCCGPRKASGSPADRSDEDRR